jgi:hypothetical protein
MTTSSSLRPLLLTANEDKRYFPPPNSAMRKEEGFPVADLVARKVNDDKLIEMSPNHFEGTDKVRC